MQDRTKHKFLKPKCWKIDRLNHVTAKSRETSCWFQIFFSSFFYLYLHLGKCSNLTCAYFSTCVGSTQPPFLGNHRQISMGMLLIQGGSAWLLGCFVCRRPHRSLGEVFGGSDSFFWLKKAADICSCSRKRSHIPPLRMVAKSSFFTYVPACDGGGICDRSLEGMYFFFSTHIFT